MRSKFRKGMHVIAKYEGDNGDLIVGRIESVRTNGDIIGENLLTGARFTKHSSILEKRNVICTKAIAFAVIQAADGDKKIARKEAVAFSRLLNGKSEAKEEKVKAADEKKIKRATDILSKLSPELKQEVLKRTFPEAAKAFQ